ncbi:MAG TPA: hypothetical protein VIX59_21390 [Candidatus Binataceae bacterium]
MKAIFVVPGREGGEYQMREAPSPSAAAGEMLAAARAAGTNRS